MQQLMWDVPWRTLNTKCVFQVFRIAPHLKKEELILYQMSKWKCLSISNFSIEKLEPG